MKPLERAIPVVLAATLAVGALVACSSSASSGSSASPSKSAAGSTSASPAPTATGKPVEAAELTALLANRTYSGEYNGAPYSEYYDANGTLRGKDVAGATSGTWKVQGDKVCFTYTTDATPTTGCYTANLDGNTVLWFKDGVYNDSTTFVIGNPNNY